MDMDLLQSDFRGETAQIPVITYSLRAGKADSRAFYHDLYLLADQVEIVGEDLLKPVVNGFLTYLREGAGNAPASSGPHLTRAEALLDLLMIGMLWRIYGLAARRLSLPLRQYLTVLSRLGERHPRLKKAAYFARGLFSTRLRPPGTDSRTPPPPASAADLEVLRRWMVAAGRLGQESKRVGAWIEYFQRRSSAEVADSLIAVVAFAEWFEARSLACLGPYTPCVEQFLRETHPTYRWREDFLLCGRQRVEYHLNMVGVEILNRALRDDFIKTKNKIVLVPPCMAALPDDRCRAALTPSGKRCAGCTPGCRVHKLTRLGEERGFSVFTLPDDLRVFSGDARRKAGSKAIGIIGVSCTLTNLQGGWDVRDLGIPAQGLLLEYCGCTYHWSQKRVPTDINFDRLLALIEG